MRAAYLDYNRSVEISSPPVTTSPEVSFTPLLDALARGERDALHTLFPLVYEELRAVARRQRRGWRGDLTLETTALVHEAYLKLVDQARVSAASRAHFLAVAAKAMRQILCNYAMHKRRLKRGGGIEHVPLDTDADVPEGPDLSDEHTAMLTALDDALRMLETVDRRQAEIVECRFFGGMSIDDTAEALATSPATVKRHWTLARTWLYREMKLRIPDADA